MHFVCYIYHHFQYYVATGADATLNARGIQAVEEVLKEARKLAKGLPPEKREAIEKLCSEIESLMKELAELQAKGQVSVHGHKVHADSNTVLARVNSSQADIKAWWVGGVCVTTASDFLPTSKLN